MFKFRFFSLVVISMMLIVGLAASSVLAKPGSVKVDSDDDCIADKEDNEITTDDIWVWMNINTSSPQGCTDAGCTKCIDLIQHSDGTTACTGSLVFADDGCDNRPDYLIAYLNDLCGVLDPDLYTLLVHSTNNCNSKLLGADSFSVE